MTSSAVLSLTRERHLGRRCRRCPPRTSGQPLSTIADRLMPLSAWLRGRPLTANLTLLRLRACPQKQRFRCLPVWCCPGAHAAPLAAFTQVFGAALPLGMAAGHANVDIQTAGASRRPPWPGSVLWPPGGSRRCGIFVPFHHIGRGATRRPLVSPPMRGTTQIRPDPSGCWRGLFVVLAPAAADRPALGGPGAEAGSS